MNRMLKLPDVVEKVGLSRSAIYDMMADGKFPPARMLSARRVGWIESQRDDWMFALPTARSGEGLSDNVID